MRYTNNMVKCAIKKYIFRLKISRFSLIIWLNDCSSKQYKDRNNLCVDCFICWYIGVMNFSLCTFWDLDRHFMCIDFVLWTKTVHNDICLMFSFYQNALENLGCWNEDVEFARYGGIKFVFLYFFFLFYLVLYQAKRTWFVTVFR